MASGSKGEATAAEEKMWRRSVTRQEMSGCSAAAAEAAAHDGEHDAGLGGDGAGEGSGVAAIGDVGRMRLLGDGVEAAGVEQPEAGNFVGDR